MTDIAFLPAKRLAGLIRRGKIGSLELLDHYLARVERFNPALNAIIATDIPAARRRARAADRALAKGEAWGPLHGVPMTVKESFDVAGLPTTWGAPVWKNSVADEDALSVARLRAAGAIVFGKTNVPMWLADTQAFNSIYGRTKSPWDLERTPGGSSGGASAALAAGLTGLELGSDIAGSIRNPAAYCGLFGLKPTQGICPPHGHALGGNVAPLDMLVIGPLGRSADDLALGLDAIAGPDAIDAAGVRLALPKPKRRRARDFRVAIITDDETVPIARALTTKMHDLARFLRKAKVKTSDTARPDIDLDETHRLYDVLLRAATSARQTDEDVAANIAARDALPDGADTKQARMLRGVTLSHRDWLRLDEARHRLRWKWHAFFAKYDLLICPLSVAPPFPHETTPTYERELAIDGVPHPFMNQVFWAGLANMAYLPAVSAPIGFTEDGLPVGAQIIGPQYGDHACIAFARFLEREYQGFVPPPGYE